MSNYPGIDYSGTGATCNRDADTGIRYGVISTRSLTEWFWDSVENDYGDATCPECGNPAVDIPCHTVQHENGVSVIQDMPEAYAEFETAKHECSDYACESCRQLFGSESAFSDEPLGWSIDNGEYRVVDCLDSDAMILKSPFYTFAQYCSPCVPGAGNLDNPCEDGAKSYCFGHDWFDGDRAPYTVYRVADGAIVEPEKAAA